MDKFTRRSFLRIFPAMLIGAARRPGLSVYGVGGGGLGTRAQMVVWSDMASAMTAVPRLYIGGHISGFRPDRLSPEVRQRVLDEIAATGKYEPELIS